MNVYKVTITYAAPNGFLRSNNLVVEAQDEHQARLEAQKAIGHLNKAVITKVGLYGFQNELPVTTDQPKRGK